MADYALKLNPERCIACRACELQCTSHHRLPAVLPLGRLIAAPDGGGEAAPPRLALAFLACFHCRNPWCVAVCPTGAMTRRAEDGLVTVDPARCVGCRACVAACPWQVPRPDPTTGKVVKCDLCRDRLAAGRAPACVAACATHALTLEGPNRAAARTRAGFAREALLARTAKA